MGKRNSETRCELRMRVWAIIKNDEVLASGFTYLGAVRKNKSLRGTIVTKKVAKRLKLNKAQSA